eukprot:jgi/Astpho2/803/Aster-00657
MVSVKERIAAENAAAQERATRAEKFGSRRTSSGDVPWPPGTTTPLRSGSLSRAGSGTQPSPVAAPAEAALERVPSPAGLLWGQGTGTPMAEAREPCEETLSQAAAARAALLQAFDAKAQGPGAAAPSEGTPQAATARAALLRAFDVAASRAVREAPDTGATDSGSQAATARAALQRAFQAENTGAAAIRSAVADGAMSESQAAAARNALAEVFDAGKAAAAGGPAVRETGTQAAEARAALLKAFHASEQAAARPAASDAGGVQAAAARAALQEAFARSSSLRSSSEDQQVILSSEAAAHAAAARAAVHEVVEKGEKEAAEAAALPQLEQMRSAAGCTGRLSPSRASAGVQELPDVSAAGTAAAETQGLTVVDLPVPPEGTRGQPQDAADFLWNAQQAAEQVEQPHSQAQQGPGSTPVVLAATTAGQAAQPHEGAADLAAGGDPTEGWPRATPLAKPAVAHPSEAPSSSRVPMVEVSEPQADTGGKAAASGGVDWGKDASAGAKAPEPALGRPHKPAAAAAGALPAPEALSTDAVVPETGASHILGAAGASDAQATVRDPGSAAEAGLRHQASASTGSKSPASSDHDWGTGAFPADIPDEDQVPGIAGSLGDAEVGPAHAEAAALAATWNSLPAPDQAGSSRAAADQQQLADEWGEDAIAAAEAPAGAAGPLAAAGHAEAAAEPSVSAGGSLPAPQGAHGSPTAAQESLAVQPDNDVGGEDAFAAAEAPETVARPGVYPAAADNLTAQQAATSGQGNVPSEGSGALVCGTAATSGSESLPEGNIDKVAAADGADERQDVSAEQAAEDDWAEDDFVAGGVLPEQDQAAAELLPGPRTPGKAAPAAGSTAQTPRAPAVSEIEPAKTQEQEDWGDDDGFGDFNDAADASALEQEAGPAASARPPRPHWPAAPGQPASRAAQPAAAGGAVDLLSLRGPDYQAAVRKLLQPLTAAHHTPGPEARTSQQRWGSQDSEALRQQQTSEESGVGQAPGGSSGAGAGGAQAVGGGGHPAARPLQELLQQHAGLGLLGSALRRAGLLEGPALTAQQSAEMRAACLPRLAWNGCAAEQRLLSRLGLAEAARQAELAAQEQVRRAKERRTSSGRAPHMILCSARSMAMYTDSAQRYSSLWPTHPAWHTQQPRSRLGGRLGSAPGGERRSELPMLRRDSNAGLASAGSFAGGPSEQQGRLFSAGTADLNLDYFDTLAPPRLSDTAAASSGICATSSTSSGPQQPSPESGPEQAGSTGWKFPALSDSTATQTPQAASSGRMRALELSASSAKTPVPESSASSTGQEHISSSTSAAAGGGTWQVDWGATALQAARAAQATAEPPAPQQPSQAASLDPFAASLTLTPAAATAGAAGNNQSEVGGTRAAETGRQAWGQQSQAGTPSGHSQVGNSDWDSEGFGEFAQASPASAGPPAAVASRGSRLQAAPLRTPPAEDPFSASTGLQPSPARESGMTASANGLPIPDLSYMLSPELVLPSPS